MGAHEEEPQLAPRSPLEAAESLGVDQRSPFVPPEEPPPVARALDLEAGEELDVAPTVVEWTPERAAAVMRGVGFMLHHADPIGAEPGGDELWRMTEADALAAGAPLSRILNRYDPARRLAGQADEAELAFAMLGYAKSQLSLRGRLVAEKRARDEERPPRPFEGAELVEHQGTGEVPLHGFPPPPPDVDVP